MSGGNINAAKSVAYLRSVGVDISPETEAAWLETESATRAARRANRRELKKSCGHFRSSWTTIYSAEGKAKYRCCSDCHVVLETVDLNPPPPHGGKPAEAVA